MQMRQHAAPDSGKSGAPIAQVLNDAASTQHATDTLPAAHQPPAAPFSGKLIDLLLDTPQQLLPNEWKRTEYQHDDSSRLAAENAIIKLPELPQLPAKPTERARIPPLLQGLHQPPPLPPSGRLFPPIQDGASGFEQINDRISSANASQEARSKRKRDDEAIKPRASNELLEAQIDDKTEARDGTQPSSLVQRSDKEETSQPSIEENANKAAAKSQRGKKRKKWSDAETKDLLLGVSRFGIGKWKRILQCPDYTFNGRSAVDLKDRFRVCCPGEGSKSRDSRQGAGIEDSHTTSPKATNAPSTNMELSASKVLDNGLSPSKERPVEGEGRSERKSHAKLAELGIQTPFAPSTRRPRCRFTPQDDENLLKGFENYGAAWHLMRDDQDLGFGKRHATDLRDRFRIRYPEAYARAGHKGKARAKTKSTYGPRNDDEVTIPVSGKQPLRELTDSRKTRPAEPPAKDISDIDSTERSATKSSTTKSSLAYTPFPMDSSTVFLGDAMPSDKDGPFSPIVLNRNILQWADANTSLMASPSSGSHAVHHASNDWSMHITIPNDGVHINPLATLKLPMMAYTNHANNAIPQATSTTGPFSTSTATPAPSASGIPRINHPPEANANNTLAPLPQPSCKAGPSSADSLLRTPNLPTIVFPHVPAASARGTVHNLPTPADLLSGMGMDVDGAEMQGGGEWGGYEQR
ncbi:hypothetical protein BDU57DRAFT_314083 [Ampelomyces quisqualis]|uniref:Myb-like domain-containing protein n=1 Tax=Ampelomyces quisqualis TaxID=50730 RepID=A0A6A5QHG7_AMPQU|nr:hypothetical protein BDU57DRAFT_314083 [Ampelomyces quisqualis]